MRRHCSEQAKSPNKLRFPEPTTARQEAIRVWLSCPSLDRLELECPGTFELAYATEHTGYGRGSNVIYECKSHGRDFPQATLHAMAELLRARYPLDTIDVVTFVAPTTSGGIVERFSQRVAQVLGKPCRPLLVKQTRQKQKYLTSRAEKVANVQGAFKPRQSSLCGQYVLVLDDVFDSGLTLAEVGRTLKRNGAGKLYAATIASTPLGD